MIEIRDVQEDICYLYGPDNQLIGKIDRETVLSDVQIQILEQKAKGYYIMFEGQKGIINQYGTIENYPIGLYDRLANEAARRIKAAVKNK